VTIDEFQRLELCVGKIVAAERVEGSEKLLKLQVDFGEGQRQIISGIAKVYAPEDLLDKEAVFVTNLDPRTMMGMESQGMLLAAHGAGGEPIMLTVERTVPPGSKVS
jgi:methionine--tRNA ligase beta chain